jgi:putative membrane protein
MVRTFKDYLILYLKGLGMGAADVVPGVSGGTIAFITGIYEELIHAIKVAGKSVKEHLLKGQFAAFMNAVNGYFLIFLLAGIGTSILVLSNLILYLLSFHPVPVWSFFFGLIVASAIVVYQKIKTHNLGIFIMASVGAGLAWWITSGTPSETPMGLWFIFISGAIAICAMILPGISGSFILLLMGKYEYILTALKEVKLSIILTFIAGCIIGLTSFAHLLDWLLKRYHDLTVALLAGFMIGSLNKVWPWKKVVESRMNSKGEMIPFIEENILPGIYLELTGNQPQIGLSVALCIFGFALVYVLERMGTRMNNK